MRIVGFISVGDLRAGPEFHAALLAESFEHAAEIFQPVRRAQDVGMHNNAMMRAEWAAWA